MNPHPGFDLGNCARAAVVNRTRRVVREQALDMRAQRERSRSLWVPLLISSGFLLVIVYAVWAVLDGYDLTPNGIPDASDQLPLVLLWMLPVTAVALGMIFFRKYQGSNEAGL